MQAYLDIVRRVLTRGIDKAPYRAREDEQVENTTIGLPNQIFSHDMADGFPLLTSKKMGLKSVAIELEGFIKGITSKKWYQERGCNIWNEWANPLRVQERIEDTKRIFSGLDIKHKPSIKDAQLAEDDLGPIYGYQWRHFDEHYDQWQYKYIDNYGCHHANDFFDNHGANAKATELDGHVYGYDQLKTIVNQLAKNPNDRRMVCSAWNPNQMDMMALPACHMIWNVVVYGDTLNLWWGQRSCDLMLGVPYNIASYALLLKLLAKHAKLKEGNLLGVLGDCHIYKNHIDAAHEQITREPRPLPRLDIPDGNWIKGSWDFWAWDHTQLSLKDYNPHPTIKMEVTV